MPAGVSWPSYLKMFAASLLAMCAGAEVVHRYYRPDLVSARAPAAPGASGVPDLGMRPAAFRAAPPVGWPYAPLSFNPRLAPLAC